MALPKKRKSKSRVRKRRGLILRLEKLPVVPCKKCGVPKLPHRKCPQCGAK